MTDMPPLRGLSPHAWGWRPARNLIEGDLWVRAAATSTVSHGMGGAGGGAPQHGCAEHTGQALSMLRSDSSTSLRCRALMCCLWCL